MCKVTTREAFLNMVSQWIPKEPTCVEIGVLTGDFSQMILARLSPKYLILIDPFETNAEIVYGKAFDYLPVSYSTNLHLETVGKRFADKIISGQVRIIPHPSYEAVEAFSDNTFDLVYIDASHLYEDVKRDLNDWLPKLKDGALMCGHDYADIPGFGVRQAVDEFMTENNFEMIILNTEGGDFALKRK